MGVLLDLVILKKKQKAVTVALFSCVLPKHARVRMERRLKGITSEIAAFEEECEVQSGIKIGKDGGLWV